jgi:hypothetical protein
MSAKSEKRFCPEKLSGEFQWKSLLLEAVASKIIVYADGQYGKATQRVSWSSSSEYRRTFLAHSLVYVSNKLNHLTPNGHFSGHTAPLTYRCCIFYLFNIYTY